MKKAIIIILAMLLFIAIPALAAVPAQESTPLINDNDNIWNTFTNLTDNDLQNIKGEGWVSIEDPNFHGGMLGGGISIYEQGIVIYIFFESGLVQEYTTDGAGNLVLNGSYYTNNTNNNYWNSSNDVGTGFKK